MHVRIMDAKSLNNGKTAMTDQCPDNAPFSCSYFQVVCFDIDSQRNGRVSNAN